MYLIRSLILLLLFYCAPVFALNLKAPDIAENGAVIPITVGLDNPLVAGQELDILVNDEVAARFRVFEGQTTSLSTRVMSFQRSASVSASVIDINNRREIDRADKTIKVTIPSSPHKGDPTVIGKLRERIKNGQYKALLSAGNGFIGTLDLKGSGYHAAFIGSRIITKNPYLGVNGNFSDKLASIVDPKATTGSVDTSLANITRLPAAPSPPAVVSRPAPIPAPTPSIARAVEVPATPPPVIAKPAIVPTERLVLMPLRVGEESKNLQGAMETALVEGLQQNYVVFSGEQVAQKAREIFLKESRSTKKKECDETRCMQGIAEAFQAELIGTANVTRIEGGYFLALSIQNIFDNKVVFSKTIPCENCSAFKVVERLKVIGLR